MYEMMCSYIMPVHVYAYVIIHDKQYYAQLYCLSYGNCNQVYFLSVECNELDVK